MYISSKKYTKEGRKRFGSEIFINDLKEDHVDAISGIQRNPTIFISTLVLILLKLASANFLGLVVVIPFFLLFYFFAIRTITIRYTKKRLLIEQEYSNPRLMRVFSLILFGIVLYNIGRYALSDFNYLKFRLRGMSIIFQNLDLYDTRYFIYRNIVRSNFNTFLHLDTIVSVIIALWFGFQFLNMKYVFTEISLHHVSEQLIKIKNLHEMRYIVIFASLYSLIQILVLSRFSILFLIITLLIYQQFPKEKVYTISIIGSSNRIFVGNLAIPTTQLSNLSRTTAATFGWIPSNDQSQQKFPENIVPREVASQYRTGLQAYRGDAYRQGNLIGLVISTLVNSFIIISLIRFALQNIRQFLERVYFTTFVLIGTSAVLFFVVSLLSRRNTRSIQTESLLVGDGFISRYLKNSLWILRGSSMEGTTIQRNQSHRLIRYDKARGLIIEWERFTLLFLLVLFTSAIAIWASLGAINLQAVPFVFPALIDSGTHFLEQKAQTQLEFFIIGGYLIWILVIFLSPRYYARSRPTLFLDMEYGSIEPVVLRDFNEHQDASLKFTKSLVSAHDVIRKRRSRPGTFVLTVEGAGNVTNAKKIRFYAGENKIVHEISAINPSTVELYHNLFVSALKGYPEIEIIIEVYGQNNLVMFTEFLPFSIYYGRSATLRADLGQYGYIDLSVFIRKQKS